MLILIPALILGVPPEIAWPIASLLGVIAYRLSFRASYERLETWDEESHKRKRSDGERFWLAALWAGPLAMLFWPVYLMVLVLDDLGRTIKGAVESDYDRAAALLGGESKEKKRKRKTQELERSRNRTDDLERELKLGPYAEEEVT